MLSRSIHRTLSIVVVVFTLFLGVTGTWIEMIDGRSILTNPSPFDPNVMAMREDFAGPGDFRVLATADHRAAPLPAGADLPAMMARVTAGARRATGDAPLAYVELRMAGGRPVGQVQSATTELRFDPATGAALGRPPKGLDESRQPRAFRNTIKSLHRMTRFGSWAMWINPIISLALAVLIVTGIIVYLNLYRVRRLKRPNPFWKAGGWWRALHRSVSIVAALFLTVVVASGSWLAVESLLYDRYLKSHADNLPVRFKMRGDPRKGEGPKLLMPDRPLAEADVPRMAAATVAAFGRDEPGMRPRVVRVRYYGGMPQGIVIVDGQPARQIVYNTATGREVSLSEPGYPETGFPFGWQAHQTAKAIHRGDYIGVPGRLMSILAGLALIYLSVSGIVMYWQMWSRRRGAGRRAFFWN